MFIAYSPDAGLPMKRISTLLTIAVGAMALVMTTPTDALARPPICDGKAGSCTWEVGYDPGSEEYYYDLACPNGDGAFFLISAVDALLACA